MHNPLSILNKTRQQFGWAASVRLLVDRLGAKLFHRQVMEVVWLDLKQAEACSPIPGFEFRFLSADEVREYSQDPSMDLEPSLGDDINRGESLCFAALDGGHLAAYGWYAIHQAAPQHCFGVGLRMPADVSYMFKGFTHPTYRGRRLHAVAMGLALSGLSSRGIRALISTVEWTNEASLRSCDRLGYLRLGRISQEGPANHRRVSIPARILPQTGVEFVPAHAWPATPEPRYAAVESAAM
jgi:hypothetical protein